MCEILNWNNERALRKFFDPSKNQKLIAGLFLVCRKLVGLHSKRGQLKKCPIILLNLDI